MISHEIVLTIRKLLIDLKHDNKIFDECRKKFNSQFYMTRISEASNNTNIFVSKTAIEFFNGCYQYDIEQIYVPTILANGQIN